ncbi:hypothetical protein CHS0354_020398, partial [Potamilus streckersoni]
MVRSRFRIGYGREMVQYHFRIWLNGETALLPKGPFISGTAKVAKILKALSGIDGGQHLARGNAVFKWKMVIPEGCILR